MKISCFEALGRAWTRMVHILFKPFDIAKWFILGFVVWVATLGENGGGGNFQFPSGNDNSNPVFPGNSPSHSPSHGMHDFFQTMDKLFYGDKGTFIERLAELLKIEASTLYIIIFSGIALFLIIILISLVLAWLKLRFKFMLVHNLSLNKTDITEPWKKYKHNANSAFKFFVVFNILSFIFFGLMLLLVGLDLESWFELCIKQRKFVTIDSTTVISLSIISLITIICSIAVSLAYFFFEEFVIPIMYKKNSLVISGWQDFLGLLKNNKWIFFKYLILKFIVVLAGSIATVVLGLVTCCIGFIIMMIPYIGLVLILPLPVLYRLMGLELLAAFGDDYNVFYSPENEPPQITLEEEIPTEATPSTDSL